MSARPYLRVARSVLGDVARRWPRPVDRHALARKWFRHGYLTALDDIERTSLQPTTRETREASAKRAIHAWEIKRLLP